MLQRQRLISLLLLLLGIFLLYFVFWDSFAGLFASYENLQTAWKEREGLTKLIDGMDQFKKTYARISERARPIFQAAPVTFDESTYIITLQNVLSKSGFILQSISIGNPDDGGRVPINAGIAGNPSGLERLLKNVERSLPLFEAKTIAIGSEGSLQSFNLSLESYLYVYKPAQGIDPNKNFAQRLQSIEEGLKTNLDMIDNNAFKEFQTNGDLPVRLPPKASIGRENPFEPF